MNQNIFQASKEYPFHISVGVVLTNNDGLICCHFYKRADLPIESEGKSDLYLLMRETIQPNESLETAISRGLQEEFGARGTLKAYIGSIKSSFPLRVSKVEVEKITLYFHVGMTEFNPITRDQDEVESKSVIQWIKAEDLDRAFMEQGRRYNNRNDLDESQIVRNYIKYVKSKSSKI
ncbi:MAG: NUDIX hydrolase [bacterium]|nr:NUDIX hydrolase [bacterium]